MDAFHNTRAIIIGDSTNNTLSAIRSLGEAKVEQCLILKCDEDVCCVSKSKYLNDSNVFKIENIEDCLPVLLKLKEDKQYSSQTIICSFDEAAVFIDSHENELYPAFRTPARGQHVGNLFNKDAQCKLAEQCGLTVPKSAVFNRSDDIESIKFKYPILLKPLNSTKGEKSDIHICRDEKDLQEALNEDSTCENYVLQEFIDKDYELDCIGVRTEQGTYIAGAVHKIRHYPKLVGAGAYGLFVPTEELPINTQGVELFLNKAGYYGPFSVEFLHKGDKDYFMEVNFRNEGLAYAATAAGANLHALYLNPELSIDRKKVRKIYMMNYALDFLYVKSGDLPIIEWIKDFLRTRCFININFRDLSPILHYYKNKFIQKIRHK